MKNVQRFPGEEARRLNETFNEKTTPSRYRKILPCVALVILLSLTVWTWWFYGNLSEEKERLRFSEYVDEMVRDVTGRLERYKMVLSGGAGVFAASEGVTREEWQAYYEYQQVSILYPGVQGVGFSRVVRSSELTQHVQEIRAAGYPDYTVRPPGEREIYTPVIFLEPFDDRNQRAFGYDIFSEPARRAALERARDTGAISMSGRVTLVTETDEENQPGFLMYLPIYAKGAPQNSIEERRRAIQGYVLAVFRIYDLMHGIFPDVNHKVDFELYDGAAVSPAARMYHSHLSPGDRPEPVFTSQKTLDLYGHQWTLAFESMPAFEAAMDRYAASGILLAGIIISLLIFLFLKMLESIGDRAFSLARAMTSALRESEEKLRQINDNIDEVFWLQTADPYRILYINRAYEQIWGRSCQSLLENPEPFMESIVDEDKIRLRTALDQHKQSGELSEEYRIARPDGAIRWVYARTFPVKDMEGHVIRYGGVARDITERKQAETRERNRNQILSAITSGEPLVKVLELIIGMREWEDPESLCSVLLMDKEEQHLLCGAAPGLPDFYNQAIHGLQIGDGVGSCGTAAYTGQRVVVEDTLTHPYWTDFWDLAQKAGLRSCWSEPILSSAGKVLGTFAVYHREPRTPGNQDIEHIALMANYASIAIENKQAEQDRIARQVAEAASREKSMFLSNMSHEIRTPMNAILGFAQILERDPSLTPKQTEQMRSINRAGRHLLNLINDILDMSKIEAGMTVLKPTVFCLHDLLDDLQMMFRSRADARGLRLLMERDGGLPYHVFGDEGKLRQVLVNLMGNAVKFTERGGVAVRVRVESADGRPAGDEQSLRLVVEVEDSGPGIPQEDLDRIFVAFGQAEAGDKAGGTGLGLAISRRLVEMMGGRLTVESEGGQGSCFRFDVLLVSAKGLPEAKKSESRLVVGLEPGSGPWRILVVDDVRNNRDLLCDLLRPLGFEIREAENGASALEIFREWSPHAVLMDMRMPVMDGYEATRWIKADESGSTTPVIAVTASAFKDSEGEVQATGVSAYLRKPFRSEELYEALGQCLGLRYVYADDPTEPESHSKPLALTPESLGVLPGNLVQAMRQAVAEGDMARLGDLITQVVALDNGAALALQALADRYDYGKLAELLGEREE